MSHFKYRISESAIKDMDGIWEYTFFNDIIRILHQKMDVESNLQ